jgi:hypothetical protein
MRNLCEACLDKIKARRQPGLDFNPNFIFPHYEGYSVTNLPASISHWLGVPVNDSKPLDDEITKSLKDAYDQVILVVVDSLGMPLFNRLLNRIIQQGEHSIWQPLLEKTTLACLTSTSPSTTTTVLTSLWTGKEPIQHGMVGYEMWLPEFEVIANMISHAPVDHSDDIGSLSLLGFNPQEFLPVECFGTWLRKARVESKAFMHTSIAGSGLSQMLMKDATIHAWRTYEELWQMLLAQNANSLQKSYTYVYLGDLDTISHRHGPGHELVWQAWLDFSNQLANLLIKLKDSSNKRSLFLLTADHGQIAQEIKEEYELKNHPRFLEYLRMLPSGESRMPYLFSKAERGEEINEYCDKTWPGKFKVINQKDFLAAGVLGTSKPNKVIQERLGEWIVIPTGKDYLRWAQKENRLRGRHGGFLADEMIIPFMAIEI